MSKKIILALVSVLLMTQFASAVSYRLFTNHCTTTANQPTCTLTYLVNASSSLPSVIMISGGYWSINNVSLPVGCTQKQFANDIYGYSTAYAAICTQTPGLYSVTAVGIHPGTYISEAAYVLSPGKYTFTTKAATTNNAGTLSITQRGSISFCSGASGNGLLQNMSGTVDVFNSDSAVWHHPTVCSEATPSPPLTLVSVSVS